MSPEVKRHKVVIIVGPTAVGKTRLSIELALRVNGEVVSADSRYIYRGMDIGSAKPTLAERKGVPHHMIDIANPDEIWSLAQYFDLSKKRIHEIVRRDHLPIIVGGTGQYIRGLTEGWSVPVMEPNPQLRKALSDWGQEIGPVALYDKLTMLDPEAREFIDPSNIRRTIRALEVIFLTGEKFSNQRKKMPVDFDFWIIGLNRPREELYELVDQRIDNMFENGLIEEVRKLINQGYRIDLPSMSAIGYREVAQYLYGSINLDEAKTIMKRNTRNFIRRQANWFKTNDPSIHWYSMDHDPIEIIHKDLNYKFLQGGMTHDNE